jgi:hypothetical protein
VLWSQSPCRTRSPASGRRRFLTAGIFQPFICRAASPTSDAMLSLAAGARGQIHQISLDPLPFYTRELSHITPSSLRMGAEIPRGLVSKTVAETDHFGGI